MTTIVNGLKQQYESQVDFQLLDASKSEGARLFEFYGLLGHPSYILLDPEGVEHWRGIGPFERDQLAEQILTLSES